MNSDLKNLCLTAALATAWAAPTNVDAGAITPNATFRGTVTAGPVAIDNVVIAYEYNVNGTSPRQSFQFLNDGLAPFETAPYVASVFDGNFGGFTKFTVLGIYQGTETSTVTVGLSPTVNVVGMNFDELFPSGPNEAAVQSALTSSTLNFGVLSNFVRDNNFGTTVPGAANLYNFSDATLNGAATALVPEPATITLCGLAAAMVMRRRR